MMKSISAAVVGLGLFLGTNCFADSKVCTLLVEDTLVQIACNGKLENEIPPSGSDSGAPLMSGILKKYVDKGYRIVSCSGAGLKLSCVLQKD